MQRSEQEFILSTLGCYLSGRHLSSDWTARLSELDWPSVVRAAEKWRVLPMLQSVLARQQWPKEVPSEFREALRHSLERVAQSNLIKTAHVAEIASALASRGVSMMLLKGMALNQLVYLDGPHRAMGDIDFLVRENEWMGAFEALRERGFHRKGYTLVVYDNLGHTRLRGRHTPPAHTDLGRVGMIKDDWETDLHWDPGYGFASEWLKADYSGMWERGRRIRSYPGKVFVPSLTDCFHVVLIHAMGRLRGHLLYSLVDLGMLIQKMGSEASVRIEEVCQKMSPVAAKEARHILGAVQRLMDGDIGPISELLEEPEHPFVVPRLPDLTDREFFRFLPSWPARTKFLFGYLLPERHPRTREFVRTFREHWKLLLRRAGRLMPRKAPAS